MSLTAILYQDPSETVTVLDIPRSLELAQGHEFARTYQIYASEVLKEPFATPEPKSTKALAQLEPENIEDLLLMRHLDLALQNVKTAYHGPFCLQRVTESASEGVSEDDEQVEREKQVKRKRHKNDVDESLSVLENDSDEPSTRKDLHIPPNSAYIQGDLQSTLPAFKSLTQKLDLVIIDPPWPNRSARRRDSYRQDPDISSLLSSMELRDHLDDEALVGVWITNKSKFRDLILGPGGFFDQIGVELLEEWVWLKVTDTGDPIYALESRWRKPWEILLLGSRVIADLGLPRSEKTASQRRLIIASPDLHSRKPNLKELVEPYLPDEYLALEVFARNLTESWLAWGNEVCKYQTPDMWAVRAPETDDMS